MWTGRRRVNYHSDMAKESAAFFPARALALALLAATWILAAGWAQTESSSLDLLKSSDADTRAKAARQIGKSGDRTSIPALASALKDPSAKVRREVVVALAGYRQPEALDALITGTRDSDPDVRITAVQGLVGYYTGQMPSLGFTGVVKRSYRAAKSAFSSDDARVDPGVRIEPKVVSALVADLGDTNSIRAARESAKGLGILMAQPAAPDLVKAAHSLDADLARESLEALAKIKDPSSGPGIVDLLDSPHAEVRQQAAVTAGILRTRAALPKLQAMYEKDTDKKTREVALQGLAYLADPASDPVFLKALWSDNKRYRALGAEGLGRAQDTEERAEIQKALGVEKDGDAKHAKQYAMANMADDKSLDTLVHNLDSALHSDVARVYLIELSRNPKMLPKLYPYLRSQDSTVRKELCTVLVFTGDRSSLEALEPLSHDKNNDVAVEALRAIRAIHARQESAPASGS